MTQSTTDSSAGHRHDRHCYWDHRVCGWVCGPRPAAATARPEAQQPAASAERARATTR